jgi:tmRNA-binding protein
MLYPFEMKVYSTEYGVRIQRMENTSNINQAPPLRTNARLLRINQVARLGKRKHDRQSSLTPLNFYVGPCRVFLSPGLLRTVGIAG